MGRKRKSPRKHRVHTKAPRYHVKGYSRGKGDIHVNLKGQPIKDIGDGIYAKVKIIDGKEYFEYLASRRKSQARKDQKIMQDRGYFARIIPRNTQVVIHPDNKLTTIKEYVVWVRKKVTLQKYKIQWRHGVASSEKGWKDLKNPWSGDVVIEDSPYEAKERINFISQKTAKKLDSGRFQGTGSELLDPKIKYGHNIAYRVVPIEVID
jgi:hypothetical protein